jgi:hypothetical protein
MQCAVGLHSLDEHRQLVHVGHHPSGCVFPCALAPDQANQVARLVDPHLVDVIFDLPTTDVADGFRRTLPSSAGSLPVDVRAAGVFPRRIASNDEVQDNQHPGRYEQQDEHGEGDDTENRCGSYASRRSWLMHRQA